MTSANMKLVALKVPLPTDAPVQKLDPGEHIIRRIVELNKLKAELDGMGPNFFMVFRD